MSIIYVLIPVAILLTILGIFIFFWAVKSNQFNDLEKEGMSILFDDDKKQTTQQEQDKVESETATQSSKQSD